MYATTSEPVLSRPGTGTNEALCLGARGLQQEEPPQYEARHHNHRAAPARRQLEKKLRQQQRPSAARCKINKLFFFPKRGWLWSQAADPSGAMSYVTWGQTFNFQEHLSPPLYDEAQT